MRENLPQEASEMTRGRNEKCCGVNFHCHICVHLFAGGWMWLLRQAFPRPQLICVPGADRVSPRTGWGLAGVPTENNGRWCQYPSERQVTHHPPESPQDPTCYPDATIPNILCWFSCWAPRSAMIAFLGKQCAWSQFCKVILSRSPKS